MFYNSESLFQQYNLFFPWFNVHLIINLKAKVKMLDDIEIISWIQVPLTRGTKRHTVYLNVFDSTANNDNTF